MTDNKIDFSKYYFYLTLLIAIIAFSFLFGMYSGARKNFIYETAHTLKHTIKNSLSLVASESTTITKIRPEHFLQPARYEGEGITINKIPDENRDLIFLTGFFEEDNQLRLIRRNGTVVASWPVKFSEIFPETKHIIEPPVTDWNIDIDGALALPDGSVVFNFEYAGLVKLDRWGNLVWKLDRMSHHSVEVAEGGGFWVPGRRYHDEKSKSPFPPFETPYYEDTILRISEDGNVLSETSAFKLFYDNGLEALITATGHMFDYGHGFHDNELVHLNKIIELKNDIADDFPMFKTGDIALSYRQLNLIIVIDPVTFKIKWWQVGPWLRQHDPIFLPGGKISVFNNNIFRTAYKNRSKCPITAPRISNIIEIDPASNIHKIVYGGKTGQEMLTIVRGKHELTPNGGLLIDEFEGGRVFETDVNGNIVWEFINRYDSDTVAEITGARIYPSGYFNIANWYK